MRMNSQNANAGETISPRKERASLLRVTILLVPALALAIALLDWLVWRPQEHRSPRTVCRAHLRQIQGAKETWALEHKKLPTDIPVERDIYGGKDRYLARKLICPVGGNYTFGAVSAKPACSVPGHTF